MLQLFFTVAFSAAPLTLYFPPIRNLSLFVETVAFIIRDAVSYALNLYPRLRIAFSRVVSPHVAAAARR